MEPRMHWPTVKDPAAIYYQAKAYCDFSSDFVYCAAKSIYGSRTLSFDNSIVRVTLLNSAPS